MTLLAARRRDLLRGYAHPLWLAAVGWITLALAAAAAVIGLREIGASDLAARGGAS